MLPLSTAQGHYVLVVAEKPSVARDIAWVVGARTREEGCFRGGRWIVTWAIGHLVALAQPHEMNPAWKKWRLGDLPLLPSSWPLVVVDDTKKQFGIVKKMLRSKDVRGVVCATDAGREGELIFRYIYEAARSKKPVKRLWISSLTPDAIQAGMKSLRAWVDLDPLADAARARSRADWLVGMNLSRLYSVLHDDNLSVGRVQTPTLAILVERELEIRAFVPEDYLEVVATFAAEGTKGAYDGTWVKPDGRGPEARRLPADGVLAAEIVRRARAGKARIASVDRQSRRLPPPNLYDLTELQRHANRLYGFTAQRTLQVAQSLYERHKLISYPRTDSRWLSRSVASTLPGIVEAVAAPYRAQLAPGTGTRALGPRFVDDTKVTDHHAIIPTGARPGELPSDERKLFDLICRRLLSAWHGDHVFAVTNVTTEVTHDDVRDRFASSGTSVEEEGWRVLDVQLARGPRPAEPLLPGGLARGIPCKVKDAKAIPKKTRPPPRFTDASLLTAMETAGRSLGDAGKAALSERGLEVSEVTRAMRDRGLGTPATRAAILETLLRRDYVVRDGKMFVATDKGVGLVGRVHPHVKSPAMTGEWEAKLLRIERGEEKLDAFMAEIARYVRDVVSTAEKSRPD